MQNYKKMRRTPVSVFFHCHRLLILELVNSFDQHRLLSLQVLALPLHHDRLLPPEVGDQLIRFSLLALSFRSQLELNLSKSLRHSCVIILQCCSLVTFSDTSIGVCIVHKHSTHA